MVNPAVIVRVPDGAIKVPFESVNVEVTVVLADAAYVPFD